MKIKEFSILQYGPLPKMERIQLQDFNLFFGKNEDGKTLSIDALVKLLLGRNVKDFERIDRVDESPEGYILLEVNSKKIKIPEKGDLTKITKQTSSDCRNIFIIRDSDLSIPESDFYVNVKDRLMGLRTEEISKIKKALQKIGKLTILGSTASLSNAGEFGKVGSRVNGASGLIKEITSLRGEIEENEFDSLEEEASKLKREIKDTELKLNYLENARRRETCKKGKNALVELQDALNGSVELEVYNDAEGQLWRDKERDIATHTEEKKKLQKRLREHERELNKVTEKLGHEERDFQVLEGRNEKLDEIKPELKVYEIKKGELAQQKKKNKFFTKIGILSIILFCASLTVSIFNPTTLFYISATLFYILAVLFSISAAYFGISIWQFAREMAWAEGVYERNKLALSKLGLDGKNVERVLSNVQKFNEDYRNKNDELQETRRNKENWETKVKELRDDTIPNIKNKVKEAKEEIDKLKEKTGESSLKNYNKKLESKTYYKTIIGEQESSLRSLFEAAGEGIKENVLYWDEEIKNLEEYNDKAIGVKFDENIVRGLQDQKQEFEEEREEINEKMASLQSKMKETERKANEILHLEGDYLHCNTSNDLDSIEKKLEEFKNENNTDNVLKVLEIFEEIETEESEKATELFGKESPISKHFNEITGGLYEEVLFNQGNGKIEVKRKDGEILEAEKLSGGTFDQLYLSIRLALGEKILKGGKGFFIMDDPFVKSDITRLKRQIKMLKKISKEGWQILYFSSKDEIKDILKRDIKKGDINFVEIQGIFS